MINRAQLIPDFDGIARACAPFDFNEGKIKVFQTVALKMQFWLPCQNITVILSKAERFWIQTIM